MCFHQTKCSLFSSPSHIISTHYTPHTNKRWKSLNHSEFTIYTNKYEKQTVSSVKYEETKMMMMMIMDNATINYWALLSITKFKLECDIPHKVHRTNNKLYKIQIPNTIHVYKNWVIFNFYSKFSSSSLVFISFSDLVSTIFLSPAG
jgi:hypothetical protein